MILHSPGSVNEKRGSDKATQHYSSGLRQVFVLVHRTRERGGGGQWVREVVNLADSNRWLQFKNYQYSIAWWIRICKWMEEQPKRRGTTQILQPDWERNSARAVPRTALHLKGTGTKTGPGKFEELSGYFGCCTSPPMRQPTGICPGSLTTVVTQGVWRWMFRLLCFCLTGG